jgi:hypothetical protein
MEKESVSVATHIQTDMEHISRRDGTLLVGAVCDKSQLSKHDIERIDTQTLDHLKKTSDG